MIARLEGARIDRSEHTISPLRYGFHGNCLKLEGTLDRKVVEALLNSTYPLGFTLKDKRELAWEKVQEAAQLLLKLSLQGKLLGGESIGLLDAEIIGTDMDQAKPFQLDVSGLEDIDSVGLAALVHLLDTVEVSIGKHYVIYPSEKVMALMRLYHLDELLDLQVQGKKLESPKH